MNYQQWLQSYACMSLFTNEEILNGSPMPDGWFNPYTISQEQIDNMRDEFKGSGLDWMRYCQEYLPQLDSKAERRLKIESKKIQSFQQCGKVISWIGKDGLPCKHIHNCNRYDICRRCNSRRKKEHIDRLRSLDGCRFVLEQNMTPELGKGKVYNFTLTDGRKVSVIETDQPIGMELNYDSIKGLTDIAITGKRTSGNLGKSVTIKEEVKEQRTVMVTSHIMEALAETKEAIRREYLEATKDFLPKTLDELATCLKRCNAIWMEIVERRCENNHIVGKKILVLTEDDIDWTARQEFIKKELNEQKMHEVSTG